MSPAPDAPGAPLTAPLRRGPIVVVGSINMDLVCRTPRRPAAGETILGTEFLTIPGGKGANQAVAVAKLGGEVHFVGRVGDDDFGQRLLNGLQQHRVNTGRVTVTEGVASGCAVILVDQRGENSIVVVPGANHKLTPADIDAAEPLLRSASVVLLQLEIPYPTALHTIELCRRVGTFTILDPAPAPEKGLPRGMHQVDILTPNQTEAEILLGQNPARTGRLPRKRQADAKQMGGELLERGAGSVILKAGAKGAIIVGQRERFIRVPGFRVKVVDTTAAGDAFTGALAVALTEGQELAAAVRFANAAGARCCEKFGAQPALPSRAEVDQLLKTS